MRFPLLPTLLVAAAVATMIALGLWQLRRADEKEALQARYERNLALPPIALPRRRWRTRPCSTAAPPLSAWR